MTLGSRGWVPREQAPTAREPAPLPRRRHGLFWVLLILVLVAVAVLLVPRHVRVAGYRLHPGFAPYLAPYLLP